MDIKINKCALRNFLFLILSSYLFGQVSFELHILADNLDGILEVHACDIDSDGDLDLLCAPSEEDLIWQENLGDNLSFDWHFVAGDKYSAWKAFCVDAADLDNDGDMDVVWSSTSSEENVEWYENDGNESFTAHYLFGEYTNTRFIVTDLDKDNDADIVAEYKKDNEMIWFENNGSADFSQHFISSTNEYIQNIYACDLDKDSDMDLVCATYDNGILWYKNNGSESFSMQSVSKHDGEGQSVFAVDMDGDGDVDVLATPYKKDLYDKAVVWYENNGSESFSAHLITDTADGAGDVAAADFHQDGDIDVVVAAYWDHSILYYENNGQETFMTHILTDEAYRANCVEVVDFDQDGDQDILYTAYGSQHVGWFENDLIDSGSVSGLVANYPFNGNVEDVSGNSNHGTNYGATLTTDRFGDANSAYSFDGINNYISIPRVVDYFFTVVFWVKTDMNAPSGTQWYEGIGMVDAEIYATVDDWGIALMNGGKVGFGIGNPDQTILSATDINDNKWHCVAATRTIDTGQYHLYIDGQLERIGQNQKNILDAPNWIGIGNNPCDVSFDRGWFSGVIDDVRIYNKTLSSQEILELYNQEIPPAESAIKIELGGPNTFSYIREFYRDLYDQNRLALRLKITNPGGDAQPLENVAISATANGLPLHLDLKADYDTNTDGKIDRIPHVGFGYNYFEFNIYSDPFQAFQQNVPLEVTITEANGQSLNIVKRDTVSLSYARGADDTIFKQDVHAYHFDNYTWMSYSEFVTQWWGITKTALLPYKLFYVLNGHCFGMSATAGLYFEGQRNKPLNGNVFSWSSTNPTVEREITDFHLTQRLYMDQWDNINPTQEYNRLKTTLNGDAAILGLEGSLDGKTVRHAVLATKLMELQSTGQAVIEIYDPSKKNYNGSNDAQARNAIIDLDSKAFSYNQYTGYYVIPINDISTKTYTETASLIQQETSSYIVSNILNVKENFTNRIYKYFACSTIFPSSIFKKRTVSQDGTLAQNRVDMYIHNALNQYSGIHNGVLVNEIDDCEIYRIPTGDAAGDSLTLIKAPGELSCSAYITCTGQGNFSFECYDPIVEFEDSTIFLNIHNVEFNDQTQARFDEYLNSKTLLLDSDGDNHYETELPMNEEKVISGIQTHTFIPGEYQLFPNYPNPFNSKTRIVYSLEKSAYVQLFIYDIMGREINNPVNEAQTAGIHSITLNADNLPSGIYIIQLKAGSQSWIQKAILTK